MEPSLWSDLAEFFDERVSVYGLVSALSGVAVFVVHAQDLPFLGTVRLVLDVAIVTGSLVPFGAWALSSRDYRTPGGLIGVGPSMLMLIGAQSAFDEPSRLTDGWWWTLLAWWPPAMLATLVLLAFCVGPRRLLGNTLALATGILSSLWIPMALILAVGWRLESGGRGFGPFMLFGAPAFAILQHLSWAAQAIASREERTQLMLRMLGRAEMLAAPMVSVPLAYAWFISTRRARLPGDSWAWLMARDYHLYPLLLLVMGMLAYHGYRVLRSASFNPTLPTLRKF